MSLIDWEESYSVNNEEIDNQHKTWIAIYNELHETLISGDIMEIYSVTAATLQKMLDYARYHFNFEEEYMRKINYPDLVNHRRMHKNFDTEIYNYYRAMQDGQFVLTTAIIKLIRNWLVDHILHEDKKYRLFLENASNQP
jgi:hemerythrin-like metal-binding protein